MGPAGARRSPETPRMSAAPTRVASGRKGMVVSGHADATQAAWRMLAARGSAADAAIAGAAVLAVTQPQACTLGGDAFVLVYDAAHKRSEGLNASGPSPRLASAERFANGIPERGAMTPNVPGVVAGWEALHRRHGRLQWRDLLQPAIDLAGGGCGISRVLARSSEIYADLVRGSEASRRLFCPQARPLVEAERFVQPALARTLETLARDGAAAFYEGEIPRSIAAACEAQGGILRAADFLGYSPEWVAPIESTFRGHRVRVMPPNSYGLYLLLQLLALENEPEGGENLASPSRFAALVRAAQAAFSVGDRAVADPLFSPDPAAPLLGEAGRARLRAARASSQPSRGGTAVISVVDGAGNAATIVQSVFLVFGSGIVDAATGILLNNRMIGFTTERGHPNRVAPRKRPAHTLCPCHVFSEGGDLRFALGTPGGPGQTLTIVQVLQAMLDHGASLEEAVRAPRWSQDLSSNVILEEGTPASTLTSLMQEGIAASLAKPNSPFFGSAEGIARATDGLLTGVADFRRDATAYGE